LPHTIPEALSGILRCAACRGALAHTDSGPEIACESCSARYGFTSTGQPDLRLAGPLRRSYTVDLGSVDPLWSEGGQRPKVDIAAGVAEVGAMLPSASLAGDIAIEIGCGGKPLRTLLTQAGWHYVGVDFKASAADLLCDAHSLPFQSSSVGMIVTKALLEHVRLPHIAVAEMMRVLRPGGVLIGDVAFLQPYHQSYFHMSHEGVRYLLEAAGLEVTHLVVGPVSVFGYLAGRAPGPWPLRKVAALMAWPLDVLVRTSAWIGHRAGIDTRQLRCRFATSVLFVARRAIDAIAMGSA
jgi:SAM-dependent methyltransferase